METIKSKKNPPKKKKTILLHAHGLPQYKINNENKFIYSNIVFEIFVDGAHNITQKYHSTNQSGYGS